MISAAQIKAARALLGMDQRELSNSAEVAISTVKRIERRRRTDGIRSYPLENTDGTGAGWGRVHPSGRAQGARRSPKGKIGSKVK